MKRIITFLNIFFIFIFLILFNCANPAIKSESTIITLQTPKKLEISSKTISTDANIVIDTSTLSQDNFRYDIEVNRSGITLYHLTLKNNYRTTLTVPVNIPIDIHVGLYYSLDSSTYNEKYNVYLASDKKENIIIPPDGTEEIDLNLNLNKNLKVNSYYNPLFGSDISSFTGGVFKDTLYFSVYPLSNSANSKIINISGAQFSEVSLSAGTYSGRGILSSALNFYFYADSAGIYYCNDITLPAFSKITGVPHLDDTILAFMSRSVNIKAIEFSSDDSRYYFFNHPDGFTVLKGTVGAFTDSININISDNSNLYSSYPFIVDLKGYTDNSSKEWALFATKKGLFVIDFQTLTDFTTTNTIDQSIENSKKLIRIMNEENQNSELLITNVAINNNLLYIGTTEGIFYIDLNSSGWQSFIATPDTQFVILPESNIRKFINFGDEQIFYMNILTGVQGSDIMAIATNKRIRFANLTAGTFNELTVWDGLPFVPYIDLSNAPVLDKNLFKEHGMAPVRFVLYDGNSNKFWIGTDFGLGSVDYSEVF